MLASFRVEVLQEAGYKVRTFMFPDKLAIGCKCENFDLLLVGHLLERVERRAVVRHFPQLQPRRTDPPIAGSGSRLATFLRCLLRPSRNGSLSIATCRYSRAGQ
jgi:hypothetical protein